MKGSWLQAHQSLRVSAFAGRPPASTWKPAMAVPQRKPRLKSRAAACAGRARARTSGAAWRGARCAQSKRVLHPSKARAVSGTSGPDCRCNTVWKSPTRLLLALAALAAGSDRGRPGGRRRARSRESSRACSPTTSTRATRPRPGASTRGGRTLDGAADRASQPHARAQHGRARGPGSRVPAVAGPVTAAAPLATPALGGRKTAVIAFNFATDTRTPWTLAQIRSAIFTGSGSTSAFFREESYNQLWLAGKAGNLDGDVYGYYTLPTTPMSCNYTQWADAGQDRRRRRRVRRRRLPARHVRLPAAVRLQLGGARVHARQRVLDERRADRARDRPRARPQPRAQPRRQLDVHRRERPGGRHLRQLHALRVQRPVRRDGLVRQPPQPGLAPPAARRPAALERPDGDGVGHLLDGLGAEPDEPADHAADPAHLRLRRHHRGLLLPRGAPVRRRLRQLPRE